MFNVSLKGQEGINIKFTINGVDKPACQANWHVQCQTKEQGQNLQVLFHQGHKPSTKDRDRKTLTADGTRVLHAVSTFSVAVKS